MGGITISPAVGSPDWDVTGGYSVSPGECRDWTSNKALAATFSTPAPGRIINKECQLSGVARLGQVIPQKKFEKLILHYQKY